jgi:D-methionine transport system substrate-binding protein
VKLKRFTILIVAIFITAVSFSLSSCSSQNNQVKGVADNPVKIGVVKSSDPQWQILKDGLAKENIFIQIINFTDYTSENPALARGELDINEFQHLDYLASYNNDTNDNLAPIGATAIFPIGLYPNKEVGVKDLNDLKADDTVVIPNDDTNQSRAIHLLVSANLVQVKDKEMSILTPKDILQTSKVKVKSVQANQAAHSLSDKSISAAIINNDYIKDANLEPKDAILKESSDDEFAQRFINVWVVKNDKVNDEILNKVVMWASHSKEFLDAILQNSAGTAQMVASEYNTSKLQEILQKLQIDKANE